MDYRKILTGAAAALVAGSLLAGCSGDKNSFSVEGQLNGDPVEGQTVRLERMDGAGWVQVSEVTPSGDGAFTLSSIRPDAPELYRLAYGDQYIYLPVDSLEQFTLTANAAGFGTGFKLAGSPQAEQLTAFEAEANRVASYANADSTASFRRRVYQQYLHNSNGNILSYYILTRKLGDEYLIDYTDPLYWAVATQFEQFKPGDPHTQQIVARAMEGQKKSRTQKHGPQVLEAEEVAYLEVELPDVNHNDVRLSSLLGKGKPVVLAFGGMTIEGAPEINIELRKLYDAGLADIYQVCLDPDQFAWQQAAKSLPWTVVWDKEGTHSSAAAKYNLTSAPAYFIYNAQGELVNSTPDIAKVRALL